MSKTFWNLWTGYATFYFGKVNLSIVIPVLLATYGDLSLYNIGLVSTGFMLSYALGQFLHGQISERFNPFVYIAIGLIGSAAMNLILGFSAGFFWALLIGEIIDGGFQSMGWSSTVRANAETSTDREKSSTILGTAYQFGNSIAWIVCAFAVGQWGWQAGFFVASGVMLLRGIHLLLSRQDIAGTKQKVAERAKLTLTFPIVMSGVALCLLNIIRYGVITWIPTYLYRTFDMPIEKVGLSIFLIPIAGIAGTLLYNKIKLHKDITTIAYLLVLGVAFAIFPDTSGMIMVGILLLSGFALYGPHVFLVTTVPSRFHSKQIVAASTGFIDGSGYVGSAIVGILVPFMIDKTGTWSSVFYLWAVMAVVVAVLVGIVYRKAWNDRENAETFIA